MCQHQAGINSSGLKIRKQNPSLSSVGLGIPRKRHSSSKASPATAFLAGAVHGHHFGFHVFLLTLTSFSPPAADLCRLSGGLQGEGGAGGAAVPARLPPKVSTGVWAAGDSFLGIYILPRLCSAGAL